METIYPHPYHYWAGYAHAQTAKQGYPMSGIVCSEIASDRERETYPIVYFEDLALDIPVKGRGEGLACDAQEPSGFRPEVVIAAFDKAIDAAAEGTRLLQGEMIGIAQRNVNAILNQLRKLAGAKKSRRDSGFAGCILSQSTRGIHKTSRGNSGGVDRSGQRFGEAHRDRCSSGSMTSVR